MPLSSFPTVPVATDGTMKVLIVEDEGVAVLDPTDLDGTEHVVVEKGGLGYRVSVQAFGLGVAPPRDPLAIALSRSPSGTLAPGDKLTLTATPSGGLAPYVVRFFADGSQFGGDRAVPAGGSETVEIGAQSGTVVYKAVVTGDLGATAEASVTVTAAGGSTPPAVSAPLAPGGGTYSAAGVSAPLAPGGGTYSAAGSPSAPAAPGGGTYSA